MSHGSVANPVILAYEVEVETFWCGVIDRLPPGRTVEVWLHRDLALRRRQRGGAELVGVFRRDIPLADFRDACFAALEEMR